MNTMLCLVLAAALSLMCVLFVRYRSLGMQLLETNVQVTSSMNSWKKTDEEKQKLEKQRDELKDRLKEATLSLSEAREKAENFRDDIKTLNEDISDLRSKLPADD